MLVQYCVAVLVGAVGIYVWTRPAPSEAAVYRRRIAGTMLLAFALALAVLATGVNFAGRLE
jgi:hypothetical protein